MGDSDLGSFFGTPPPSGPPLLKFSHPSRDPRRTPSPETRPPRRHHLLPEGDGFEGGASKGMFERLSKKGFVGEASSGRKVDERGSQDFRASKPPFQKDLRPCSPLF